MEWKRFSVIVEGVAIRGQVGRPEGKQRSEATVVILCHGIPGGRRESGDPGYEALGAAMAADGHVVVLFNFRGAGVSEGNLDMRGWVKDLRGVMGVARSEGERPVLVGFSAGGAVAATVAAEDGEIEGLALCAAPAEFTRIVESPEDFLRHARSIGIVRDAKFPRDIGRWVDGFREVGTEKKMSQCRGVRTLVLHGRNDDVVPLEHAYRIFEAASEPKKLVVVEDGGHRLRLNEEAMQVVRRWINTVRGDR